MNISNNILIIADRTIKVNKYYRINEYSPKIKVYTIKKMIRGYLMETDKVFERVDRLRREKNWTVYYLCKEAGLSHSTFNNWRKRKTLPKLEVLSKLCEVLQISLPELLFDLDTLDLSTEQKQILEMFSALNREQKDLVILTMQNLLINKS